MILNKRSKVSDVSLQGTLHAVVPVTGDHSEGQAKKRLIRALLEVGDKYGMRLSFAPDETDYGELKASQLSQGVTITRDPPVDELPKCIETDGYKENTLNLLKKHGDYYGDGITWLTVVKDREATIGPGHVNLSIECPFCHGMLADSSWHLETQNSDIVADLKAGIVSHGGKTSCPTCQIAFTWDFAKNTVKMEKMGREKEWRDWKSIKADLQKAVEAVDGVEICNVKDGRGWLAVEVKPKTDTHEIAWYEVANAIDKKSPLDVETRGEFGHYADSGREIRWTWV